MNPETSHISHYAKEVADVLLKLGAIRFDVKQTFTWASGIKSPVYCDNRLINSDVDARNFMVNIFVKVIKQHFPNVEIIAGVATGGIPLGVLIADRMTLPFIYVRQEKKGHGLEKQVEGAFKENDKVVLIEDHISTGGSSAKAVQGLRDAGLNMLALVSVMTYGFAKATYTFKENDIDFMSLCDLHTILEVAHESGMLNIEDRKTISLFRENPNHWFVNQ